MPLFARDALLPDGWASDVLLDWDVHGRLTKVLPRSACPAGTPTSHGPVIPGMPNVHSHAFQHLFAGLTEYQARDDDSFWSWRTLMYRYAARMTPSDLYAIATHLYIRMLRGGYTSVCEFHYLHNDEDGRPYADDAVMSQTVLRAARDAGHIERELDGALAIEGRQQKARGEPDKQNKKRRQIEQGHQQRNVRQQHPVGLPADAEPQLGEAGQGNKDDKNRCKPGESPRTLVSDDHRDRKPDRGYGQRAGNEPGEVLRPPDRHLGARHAALQI